MEWAPIASTVAAIITFIYAAMGMRGRASKDFLDNLKSEVAELRRELEDCQRQGRDLRSELNYWKRQAMRGEEDNK